MNTHLGMDGLEPSSRQPRGASGSHWVGTRPGRLSGFPTPGTQVHASHPRLHCPGYSPLEDPMPTPSPFPSDRAPVPTSSWGQEVVQSAEVSGPLTRPDKVTGDQLGTATWGLPIVQAQMTRA